MKNRKNNEVIIFFNSYVLLISMRSTEEMGIHGKQLVHYYWLLSNPKLYVKALGYSNKVILNYQFTAVKKDLGVVSKKILHYGTEGVLATYIHGFTTQKYVHYRWLLPRSKVLHQGNQTRINKYE